jgi:hypothetical protein
MTLALCSVCRGILPAMSGSALPPADDRLYGPQAFGAGWVVAGVAAIVVAIGGILWAFRRRRPAEQPARRPQLVDLRIAYLRHLDVLERRVATRRISPRALHHELSRTLRRFASDAGTAGATAMSAVALESVGLRPTAAAVRGYERPQFEERSGGDPLVALSVARAVISGTGDATVNAGGRR